MCICHKEEATSSFVVHGYSITCSHVKGTFETLRISCNLKIGYVGFGVCMIIWINTCKSLIESDDMKHTSNLSWNIY